MSTTSSTTVSPLQVAKMEIAYVCEQLSLFLHFVMLAGFFYLLRGAQTAAKKQSLRLGTRPRELNQNMIYISASVLVFGLVYNLSVFVENCLVENCTKPWVHFNALTWMILHRTSLLAVYLFRLETCFRGSIFAYPQWFTHGLAFCIATWSMSSVALILVFYEVEEVDVHFHTGANGKTMCSWDLAAHPIFYGSRIPEFVLTIVLMFAFLWKLMEVHNMVTTPKRLSTIFVPKPICKIPDSPPASPRTASSSVTTLEQENEVNDPVNGSAYDSHLQMRSPTIETVVTERKMTDLSLDAHNTSSDMIDVELAVGRATVSTTASASSSKQKTATGKQVVANVNRAKGVVRKKEKRRSFGNRTQAYRIVFRRVGISTMIAIVSTYVVILGYKFYPPLAGFIAIDVTLNSFCVMAMFKFCRFLVKPMFGTRCQRFCCVQMVDKKGKCLCRVGKQTVSH